jgi:hypothetical protein
MDHGLRAGVFLRSDSNGTLGLLEVSNGAATAPKKTDKRV